MEVVPQKVVADGDLDLRWFKLGFLEFGKSSESEKNLHLFSKYK